MLACLFVLSTPRAGAATLPAEAAAWDTTPSGLIQDVSVSQVAQAGQPTRALISTALAKDGLLTPQCDLRNDSPPARRHGAKHAHAFAKCDLPTLETEGPWGCPPGSVIGGGSGTFDAWPFVTDYVNAQVTIFNGTGGRVLLYVFPDLGPTFVMASQPTSGSTLEFAVPPIYTLPGAPLGALAEFSLDFQSSAYFDNPPGCPTAGFGWGFDFLYESGERLSLSLSVPCTGGSPAPVTTKPPPSLPRPPARDTAKPSARAASPSRQDIDKLFIRASMSEAGTLTATGSVNLASGASKVQRFKPVTRKVAANVPVKFSPRLSRKSLRVLKRALKQRKRLKANFTLTATDQSGNTTVQKRTVRLRP